MQGAPEAFVDLLNLASQSFSGVFLATWRGAWRHTSAGSSLGLRVPHGHTWSLLPGDGRLAASSCATMSLLLGDGEPVPYLELHDLRVAWRSSPRLVRLNLAVRLRIVRGLGPLQVIERLRAHGVLQEGVL